jgi:hypothetical protein
MLKLLSTLLIAALLSACGGGDTSAPSQQAPRQAAATRASAAADYSELVQLLYVGYFGRPADAGGLANFKQQLGAMGAGADAQNLDAAYNGAPAVRDLVNSFGVSDESKALYSGDTDAFVTSIYRNLLNRTPDATGKAWWVSEIDHNGLQRSKAALSILAGALVNTEPQGRIDAQVIANKAAVSRNFTAAAGLDVYKGDAAAALARTMLAAVNQNTNVDAFQSTISSTLQQMAGGSIYAGSYSGSYGGDDSGSYTFTIAKDGTITGSGKSSVFGTVLVITGTLGSAGGQAVLLQGTIGPFTFTGTLTAGGQLTGQWSGLGASGTLSAQRTGG